MRSNFGYMPKFKAEFRQDWLENGQAIIEADSLEEAEVIAEEMIETFSKEIDWTDMNPEGLSVESVDILEDE